MESLCNDVMDLVFSKLAPKDLLSCRAVCKHWENVVSNLDTTIYVYPYNESVKRAFSSANIIEYNYSLLQDVTDDGDDVFIERYTIDDKLHRENGPAETMFFLHSEEDTIEMHFYREEHWWKHGKWLYTKRINLVTNSVHKFWK